jgi:Holliday junction resolvasome RuvABC endonuclease subunit
MKKRHTIAIDPGFGETGILLKHGTEVKEWGVFSCRSGPPPFSRAVSLVERLMDLTQQWVARYKIEELEVVIERPVWNRNASTFELQWRLIQHLESALWIWVSEDVKLWVTEVHNATSKKLATGDGGADKEKVAEASPFRRADFPSETTWTTLGDTWAHSLAAWGKNGTGLRLCYTDLKMAEVREYESD